MLQPGVTRHRAASAADFPATVQPICQNICHFPLPLCNCNPKLINKLGIMNINKKNCKPVAKRDLVQPKYFSCCRENLLRKQTSS